jgi:hypothetical protein
VVYRPLRCPQATRQGSHGSGILVQLPPIPRDAQVPFAHLYSIPSFHVASVVQVLLLEHWWTHSKKNYLDPLFSILECVHQCSSSSTCTTEATWKEGIEYKWAKGTCASLGIGGSCTKIPDPCDPCRVACGHRNGRYTTPLKSSYVDKKACSGATYEKCDYVEDGYGKYEKICVEKCLDLTTEFVIQWQYMKKHIRIFLPNFISQKYCHYLLTIRYHLMPIW